MGKTKIKTIDDSVTEESKSQKEKPSKKSGGRLPPNAASSRRGAEGDERTRGPELVEGPQGVGTEGAVSEQESGSADRSEPPDERATQKKAQKPGKAKPRSKKYQQAMKDLDRSKTYPIPEAIDMVKKLNYAKFNATLEAHINTSTLGIRGLISLPYVSGKKIRILAFGKGAEQEEYGGVIFGDDSTIESISQGKVDFDLLITTPEWMPKLAKVAKILGPKGLMPNPKNGTITSPSADGLKKAVEGFQSGKTEYKTESKAPVIHLALGKLNQPTDELSQNIKTLLQTIGKTRIKKVSLSPTMGPSVKLDLATV